MLPKRHILILEALEPISHGDTITGIDNATNTRIFMRSGQFVNGRSMRIPDISENSLRATLVRRPLHDHLIHTLGIERNTLPQAVLNLLFSGGNVASGAKSPSDDMELGYSIQELYPSLELLGGAVNEFILPRSRMRMSAWPFAREYAQWIAYLDKELAEEAKKTSIWDLLFEETRTRGTGEESSGNQMIYTYETLAAGTRILVEFTLDIHTRTEAEGALMIALMNWDGYFGGQGRQGRGRMEIRYWKPIESSIVAYEDHLSSYGETMKAGLIDGSLGQRKPLCYD